MEIVEVTPTARLSPEDQKFCEGTKSWASRRAMSDGALSRGQKELIATTVSAINVCEY
jgi:hypothetical protein